MLTYVDTKELSAVLRSLEFVISRASDSEALADLLDAKDSVQHALDIVEESL